jgi:hypothetical protein
LNNSFDTERGILPEAKRKSKKANAREGRKAKGTSQKPKVKTTDGESENGGAGDATAVVLLDLSVAAKTDCVALKTTRNARSVYMFMFELPPDELLFELL